MGCVPRSGPPIYKRYDPSDERQRARVPRILLDISGSSQCFTDHVTAGDFVDTGMHLRVFLVSAVL